MNKKRWFWASVAAFVVIMILEFIYNNYCLKGLYMATAHLWRPEADMAKFMPYYWVASLVGSFLFTYIYTKGYEARPNRFFEGLRFGLVVGLFVNLPMVFITYASMPIPFELSASWFITGLVEYTIAGVVVGLIYKK